MIDETDSPIERLAAEARRPVAFDPRFDDRVMAAVRRVPREAPVWRRLAIAAGIGALMAGSAWIGRQTAPRPEAIEAAIPATTAADHRVEFVVLAPGAGRVTLVGDFNEWNISSTPLTATGRDGVWSVTVPLSAGRHEYAFVVDGERWIADPNAPRAQSDDFGTPNSVITVTGQT